MFLWVSIVLCDSLWISTGFGMVFNDCPFQWISFGSLLVFKKMSSSFPLGVQWFSFDVQ